MNGELIASLLVAASFVVAGAIIMRTADNSISADRPDDAEAAAQYRTDRRANRRKYGMSLIGFGLICALLWVFRYAGNGGGGG